MQKQKAQQENAIIEGVIWKQLLIFFFPILLGSFFQQMYNTADTIIVGQFAGKLALAAVGSTGSYVSLLFGFFVGLASGATVILAQFFGAKNARGVHDSVHTAMALSLLAGLAVTIAGLLTSKLALDLMNVPENIYDDALIYLQIFFLGMIPLVVYNVGAGILRAVGDSKSPLYFLIASCLINVVLDLLFVAVWKGGAAGAAIATVISETLSAAMVTVALMRRKDSCHLALREIRISRPILKDTLAIGIPGGLQAVMYSVSNMIAQTVVNGFGSDSVAAWTANSRMDGIIWLVMGAFGTAITTFVGQNFGAQRYDRMRKSVRVCMGMAVVSIGLLSVLIVVFGRNLMMLFTRDEAVLDIGVQIIHSIGPFYCAYVCVEILSGAIRGTGDSVRPVIILALCTCLFRVIWVTACQKMGLDIQAVALVYFASWTLTSIVFVIYYLRGNWLKRRISVMGYAPEVKKAKT